MFPGRLSQPHNRSQRSAHAFASIGPIRQTAPVSASAHCPLDTSLTLGLAALLILLVAALAGAFVLRRMNRRNASLNRLLELADRVEADLKSCRAKLKQAHAVMSMNPDLPAASEQEASNAVDAGLRALLQQRIWIRDHAPTASQGELDAATRAMGQTRDRLRPLLDALGAAQSDLDAAMREHIRQDSHS